MATKASYECANCGKKTDAGGRLFDALFEFYAKKPTCCDRANDLYLEFPFALGVDDPLERKVKVRDVFRPMEPASWRNKNDIVTFYPFLVMITSPAGGDSVWLPYWHLVEGAVEEHAIEKDGKKFKFGQWAPVVDVKSFSDLLAQARLKGYFLDQAAHS